MPFVKCERCRKEFKRQSSWIGKRIFCSKTCFTAKIQLKCNHCNNTYDVHPSAASSSKYCSRLCHNRAKGLARSGQPLPARMRGRTRQCSQCQNDFYVRPSEERKGGIYCSMKCYRMNRHKHTNKGFRMSPEARARIAECAKRSKPWLVKDRARACLNCGVVFSHRYGVTAKIHQRFCSINCWHRYIKTNPHEHGNYIDGRSCHASRGPNWPGQRLLALQRDGYTCQSCGDSSAILHVHHIIPFHVFGDNYLAANALDNIVTLCNGCHPRIEFSGTTNAQRRRGQPRITIP